MCLRMNFSPRRDPLVFNWCVSYNGLLMDLFGPRGEPHSTFLLGIFTNFLHFFFSFGNYTPFPSGLGIKHLIPKLKEKNTSFLFWHLNWPNFVKLIWSNYSSLPSGLRKWYSTQNLKGKYTFSIDVKLTELSKISNIKNVVY